MFGKADADADAAVAPFICIMERGRLYTELACTWLFAYNSIPLPLATLSPQRLSTVVCLMTVLL
jgi:hypothetical protein